MAGAVGAVGAGFFIVVEGRVRVVRDAQTSATLGPGEFFGELSVLDGQPRNAQVAAEVSTRCLALPSWEFERVLLANPQLSLAILRGLAGVIRTRTAIVIAHRASTIRHADHIVVLDFGRKIAEGGPEEIRNDPIVIEAYLGKAAAAKETSL